MSVAVRRPRPVRDAALAVSLLTLVPGGVGWPEGERTSVAGWFPAVGLGIGSAVFAAVRFLELTGWTRLQPLLAASLLVASVALLTRFLHLDGLADVADAWWGGETTERRLAIMRDSAVGAFGAAAVALTIIVQVSAVSHLLTGATTVALLIAPTISRSSAMFAAWFGVPARDEGLGRAVMGAPDLGAVVPATLALGAACIAAWWVLGGWGVALVAFGVTLALAVPHGISCRVGGVTGDVMGASVTVVETALYVSAAVLAGVIAR